jgi:hypothetical protein
VLFSEDASVVYIGINSNSSTSVMIITTQGGQSFDTQKDLTAPERHILQKLFAWEAMASGIEQFREKKKEALQKGWNNSGPINESTALRIIIKDMEQKVTYRLKEKES